jgi:hypothetical protein
MAALVWFTTGVALWHFTVFLPDRFWGGIVGALIGALVGAVVVAVIINGVSIPGRHATHLATALDAIPGAIVGIVAMYLEGIRREESAAA